MKLKNNGLIHYIAGTLFVYFGLLMMGNPAAVSWTHTCEKLHPNDVVRSISWSCVWLITMIISLIIVCCHDMECYNSNELFWDC